MKKKAKISATFILLSTIILTTGLTLTSPVFAQGNIPYEELDDIGTFFELVNFNISIATDTAVHIVLRVSSDGMLYFIESASEATSTQLTLHNLEPLTTFYMYEDGYENILSTDDCGSCTYSHDLSSPHTVVIKKEPSTWHVKESTTLESDISGDVMIVANDIVLDLNGYSIIGSGAPGIGVWVPMGVYGVTIKNGCIRDFWAAVGVQQTHDIVISNILITSNSWYGVYIAPTSSVIIADNTFTSNDVGVEIWSASGNFIYHNNFIDNEINAHTRGGAVNVWDDGYPSGGNYWDDYTGSDDDGDGIGDTPYVIDPDNADNYPFMMEDGWVGPQEFIQVEMQVIESWELGGGVKRSLISKLEDAGFLLYRGNINGAIHKLGDLIKKVTNDAHHLTEEQKNYIIMMTEDIILRI